MSSHDPFTGCLAVHHANQVVAISQLSLAQAAVRGHLLDVHAVRLADLHGQLVAIAAGFCQLSTEVALHAAQRLAGRST